MKKLNITELKALSRSIVEEIQSRIKAEKNRIELLVKSNTQFTALYDSLVTAVISAGLSVTNNKNYINQICSDLENQMEQPLYKNSPLLQKFDVTESNGYGYTYGTKLCNLEQTVLDSLIIQNIVTEDLGEDPNVFVAKFVEDFLE